jgi:ABC-type uncharacterized transport system permease subunit
MNNKNIEKPWWKDGVVLFSKVSAYIAIPIILASYAGKILDRKYNTGSFIFFILIAIAFISTILLIWKEVRSYKNKMEKENIDKKQF